MCSTRERSWPWPTITAPLAATCARSSGSLTSRSNTAARTERRWSRASTSTPRSPKRRAPRRGGRRREDCTSKIALDLSGRAGALPTEPGAPAGVSSAEPHPLPEEAQRIRQLPVRPHLEVEMHARTGTGATSAPDELTLGHAVAPLHECPRQVRIHRDDAPLVPDLDDQSVALEVAKPAPRDHPARERRIDLRVRPALDVDPLVEASPPGTERGAEISVQRDVEQFPVGNLDGRLRQPSPRSRSQDGRDQEACGRSSGDHGRAV